MKRICLILVMVLTGTLFTGCNTMKKVTIQSTPQDALIMTHEKEKVEDSVFIDYYDPTPGEYRLNLWGKGKQRYITVQKRGYETLTQLVTMESEPQLTFQLQRIEGVPDRVFDKKNLEDAAFTLLPPIIEVYKYTGAGNLGKKKFSAELSQRVAGDFLTHLADGLKENKQVKCSPFDDESLMRRWGALSGPVKDFVLTLNAKRLPYLCRPPYIEKSVNGFNKLAGEFVGAGGEEKGYLLVIWSKCISETKGRKTANFFLKFLGGITPGAVYDPRAFDPRSGTLMVFYVIDAGTSEVLHTQTAYFKADLSKEKQMAFIIDRIKKFPHLARKK